MLPTRASTNTSSTARPRSWQQSRRFAGGPSGSTRISRAGYRALNVVDPAALPLNHVHEHQVVFGEHAGPWGWWLVVCVPKSPHTRAQFDTPATAAGRGNCSSDMSRGSCSSLTSTCREFSASCWRAANRVRCSPATVSDGSGIAVCTRSCWRRRRRFSNLDEPRSARCPRRRGGRARRPLS